jgi:hypothetical protein
MQKEHKETTTHQSERKEDKRDAQKSTECLRHLIPGIHLTNREIGTLSLVKQGEKISSLSP